MSQEIIDGYLNWYRTKSQQYWWAWQEVDKMASPKHLSFLIKLIESCLNDEEIAYVAAGPLSDLFIKYHLEIKNSLDQILRQNKQMRKAIQAIILTPHTLERKTLDELLYKYGLSYASL